MSSARSGRGSGASGQFSPVMKSVEKFAKSRVPHAPVLCVRVLTFSSSRYVTGSKLTNVGGRTLREHGAELAGKEIFQGAKAYVEFGGRQASLAAETGPKNPV